MKIKTKRKLERQNVIAGKSRRRNVNVRDESLTRRESRSRSPSGSAGAAPRRRAFSSLMLQGSLSSFRFVRAAFNQPGMLCFLIKEFCKAFWGFQLIRFTLVACACLRRPSAQREGVRAAPPPGRLLPPHLFKTSTRPDLIRGF